MQVYRQRGKIEALKAAQKKAEYLVEALGKRLGMSFASSNRRKVQDIPAILQPRAM